MNYADFLGAPPARDSEADRKDVAAVESLQHVDAERWATANADAAFVYPRFDAAFGRPVDRATSPTLIAMLNRALRDVSATTFAAKAHFHRPRPYQRNQMERVCDQAVPPQPEPEATTGSSYPSGHTAYGWATALILARVAPERAQALFARAADYGESREVCGVHFPSDIEAGRIVAVAVVSRLDGDPAFQADLAQARHEIQAVP